MILILYTMLELIHFLCCLWAKKNVLLPLTSAEIVKHDKKFAEIFKNDNALDSSAATTKEIKLKGGALIAKTSLNAENYVDGALCRTMLTMFSRHV